MSKEWNDASLSASATTVDSTATVLKDENAKPDLKKVAITVAILGFAQFMVFLTAFLPSSFYPNKAREKGLTGLQTGWIMGVLHLVVLISVYIELKLMQIVPPKKQLMGGLVICGIASIVFGFEYMIDDRVAFLVLQLVTRIIHGAALASTDVSSFVLTNMKTPIQYLSTAMAVLEAMLSLSILVGAPLGAFLLQAGGYQVPYIVAGAATILYAVIVYVWIEDTEYKENTGVMYAVKNTVTPKVLPYIYAFVIFGALLGFLSCMLEPKLVEFNLTLSEIGLVLMISNGVQAVAFPICGQICDRTGKYAAVSIVSYVIIIAGLLLFGPFPGLVTIFEQFPVFIGSIVIIAIGISALTVSAFLQCKIQLLKMGFNETIAGSLVSVSYLGFTNIGMTLGDFLGGLFIDYLGYSYGSVVWAVLMILGIVFQVLASYFNNRTTNKSSSSES